MTGGEADALGRVLDELAALRRDVDELRGQVVVLDLEVGRRFSDVEDGLDTVAGAILERDDNTAGPR